MTRPRLLDLFCGAGGAAMGYHRAGFDVVGVDIKPQPRYPFEFIQADALEVMDRLLAGGYIETNLSNRYKLRAFDAVHASPPCQKYSSATPKGSDHPDLYAVTQSRLEVITPPYVIENVIGAPYSHGVVLCGSMFALEEEGEWIQRHRNFETSRLLFQPPHRHPVVGRALLVTGHAFITEPRDIARRSRQGPFDLACRLMGIDWMNRRELTQAIPPAYTEYIGRQLLLAVRP